MEIWFRIANGQILSNFTELSAPDTIMAGYYSLTFLLLDSSGVACSFCGLVAVPCGAFFSCYVLFVALLLCLVDSV